MRQFIRTSFSQMGNLVNLYNKSAAVVNSRKPYSLINYDVDKKTSKLFLFVQIYPTMNIAKYAPIELVNDDEMLEGFDSKDIRTICFFAYKELNIKKSYYYSILRITKKNDRYLVDYQTDSGVACTAAVDELSENKELLNRFAPVEAHMLGYVSCEDSALKESFLKKYAIEM